MALESQKREVSEARITAQQFLPQVKIDDAKLKEYYDANSAEFRRPERVRAEYVMLSADQLVRNEQVSEADLKAAYQQRLAQLTEDFLFFLLVHFTISAGRVDHGTDQIGSFLLPAGGRSGARPGLKGLAP